MSVELFLDISVGFIIGIAVGMTGIGGGALVEPSLIHLLGIAPVPAVGTGLGYNFITKLGGVLAHLRLKTVKLRFAGYFLAGSVPGVLLASNTINLIFRELDHTAVNYAIQLTMGSVLVATSAIIFFRNVINPVVANGGETVAASTMTLSNKLKTALAGLLIGIVIGTTSIGGGVLIIPALMILLRLSVKEAIGTSIAISVILSSLGSIVYLINGNVDWQTMLFLSIGSLPGVYLGSRINLRLMDRSLNIIVFVLVLLSGLSLFFGLPDR